MAPFSPPSEKNFLFYEVYNNNKNTFTLCHSMHLNFYCRLPPSSGLLNQKFWLQISNFPFSPFLALFSLQKNFFPIYIYSLLLYLSELLVSHFFSKHRASLVPSGWHMEVMEVPQRAICTLEDRRVV